MKNKLSRRLIFILTILLFKFCLDMSYILIISKEWSYAGYVLNYNTFKIIESFILLFIFGALLPFELKNPSDFLMIYLFSFIAIPLLSIYGMKNKSRFFIYMILLSFLIILLINRFSPKIKIPRLKQGKFLAVFGAIIISSVIFSWIIYKGGLSYLNFNLLEVYEYRSIVSDKIFYGKMAYLKTWYGKVINIFLITYFLWKKSFWGIIITLLLQITFFGIIAQKAYLFYPVLILFVYYFRKEKKDNMIQLLLISLIFVVVFSSLYYLIANNLILVSLFVRRIFFGTANNHYRYYDYFKDFGFIYMSNSVLSSIVEYPFDIPITRVISRYAYGDTDTWVNTGFLATGFMHFGSIGMIIYSIIVGYIFRLVDSLNKFTDTWIGIAIMFIPISSLTSSDLPTILLTHGLGLSLVYLWLIDSKI